MEKLSMRIVLLLSLAVLKAVPQASPSDSISFSDARKIIFEQNDGLKSVQIETDAAQAGVYQAEVLPNPEVEIVLDKFGTNEIEVMVGQTIELGGKRKLRYDIGNKDLESAKNNIKLTQLELESEVIRRFIPIAVTMSKLTLLDSLIATATVGKEQMKRRVDAGATKKTDLIRAEIDLEKYFLERNELIRQLEQARKKFAALGGEKANQILNVTGHIDAQESIPSIQSLQKAALSSPQIASFEIDMARLFSEQKLLRAEGTPDLNLSAGVLGSSTDKSVSPLIGLSMDIPLFDKNSAAQKKSKLQQQAVSRRKENSINLLKAEIEDLHSKLIEIDKRVSILTTSTIPKSMEVYTMLQEYYNAGNSNYLELTTTRAEMLDLQMSLLNLEAEKAFIVADLMQMTNLKFNIVK